MSIGFPLPDRLWQEGPLHAWLCGQALAAVDEFGHRFDDLIDLPSRTGWAQASTYFQRQVQIKSTELSSPVCKRTVNRCASR